MSDFTIRELETWNERIETLVREKGLDFYPQEFEICSYEEMLGYEAYTGMPSHYPHWSFGKAFDRFHTYYRYNLTGLPYEMVINSNPCLAYLMRDNTLLLQVLTIAHVYGHNDFFKNNRLFKTTRAELTLETFKNHAERIRGYIQDPSIGYLKVERILDAAHAVRYQANRVPGRRRLTSEEEKARILSEYQRRTQPDQFGVPASSEGPPDLTKIPLEPEEDLLWFIAEYGRLEDWERDLLRIVRTETEYFIPQIETKILNEGWASFWHYRILQESQLPPELNLEFLKRHHQVIRPHLNGLNPYHIGFSILCDLERRFNPAKLFEVREIENDHSFIRRYLTRELCEELHLFEFISSEDEVMISEVSDETGWEKIRDALAKQVGTGMIPVIKVKTISPKERNLILEHEYDGRELELAYAEETLKYLMELWGRPVELLTYHNDQERKITCREDKVITLFE